MQAFTNKTPAYRIGIIGTLLTFVGTILSGPVALLLVSVIQAQPSWENVDVFVKHYHPIQSLTFYFGMILISGSLLMMVAIYQLSNEKTYTLVGLIFTAIATGLIFFNYFTQMTVIPALVENFSTDKSLAISILTMANPYAITWSIEMWGYGFLGVGTWLAAGFFTNQGIEKVAKITFILNGVLSLIGAFWTSFDLGWVLSIAGLVSFGLWNVLYAVLAAVLYAVLRRRQTA